MFWLAGQLFGLLLIIAAVALAIGAVIALFYTAAAVLAVIAIPFIAIAGRIIHKQWGYYLEK